MGTEPSNITFYNNTVIDYITIIFNTFLRNTPLVIANNNITKILILQKYNTYNNTLPNLN